ncbi:Uncharacterized protein HZ326_15220 [Fusarium oxysporum f. sp. albedinis]|nr:Uncharacterized protein HZ326_15220 [Fusarium oxysporum f. sp. albedinis]
MLEEALIEVYVHGNRYRNDALKATGIMESISKPSALLKTQRPILQPLILTEGISHILKSPQRCCVRQPLCWG